MARLRTDGRSAHLRLALVRIFGYRTDRGIAFRPGECLLLSFGTGGDLGRRHVLPACSFPSASKSSKVHKKPTTRKASSCLPSGCSYLLLSRVTSMSMKRRPSTPTPTWTLG